MIRFLPLILATPALAADPGLTALAAQVDVQGSAGLAAAYAACVAGQGDVDRTAAFFVTKGWSRHQDSETGMVELLSDAAPYRVTLYVDTLRCEVGSDTLDHGMALGAVQVLAAALGTPLPPPESTEACADLTIGPARIRLVGRAAPCAGTTASAAIFRFLGDSDA